jgi:hypothetical protein
MVEYLNSEFTNSEQILLGGMFFQSVYAQVSQDDNYNTAMKLFKNKNALSKVYFGNAVVPDGPDAFAVHEVELKTDETTEGNGVPTLNAAIQGIASPNPYYLLDFTNDNTILWNYQCTQTVPGFTSGSCNGEPTLMELGFNPNNNSSGLIIKVGTFTDGQFGGYVASG